MSFAGEAEVSAWPQSAPAAVRAMPSSSRCRARSMLEAQLLKLPDAEPSIDGSVFRAPGSVVVGDVQIGPESSIWYNVVIRADVSPVRIGARTNIQDGSILHADPGFPCIIGDDVTVGHKAIVHGAKVGNGALIGMGAILLNGVEIGEEAIVAAGAVVTEGTIVAPGTLVAGIPAKEKRQLDDDARQMGRRGAEGYVRNARPPQGRNAGRGVDRLAIDLERRGAIAVVTMNRPEALNAFNGEQLRLLAETFDEIGNDGSIRCVVLTGAGERAFAAGADIKEMKDLDGVSGSRVRPGRTSRHPIGRRAAAAGHCRCERLRAGRRM